MKLLAIDTAARAASAAVCDETGRILCESYVDVALTHSETLMPMLDAMLRSAALTLRQIDTLAVSHGPGSFTGLRIGISAVKGLAFPRGLPCIGVSTLEGLAYNLLGRDCVACAVMDARCNQVYTARFSIEGDQIRRLSEDEALPLEELAAALRAMGTKKPIVLVGDGAVLCYNSMGDGLCLAPPQSRYQRAGSVCLAALGHLEQAAHSAALAPAYLRLPQAERELKKKEEAAP